MLAIYCLEQLITIISNQKLADKFIEEHNSKYNYQLRVKKVPYIWK